MGRWLVTLLAVALVGVGTSLAAPAPKQAVQVAKQEVVARWHLGGLSSAIGIRSKIDPRWALVDGFYKRPRPGGLWAVWLQLKEGRWRVAYAGIDERAVEPPGRLKVPCDIQPAFSEPLCQAG